MWWATEFYATREHQLQQEQQCSSETGSERPWPWPVHSPPGAARTQVRANDTLALYAALGDARAGDLIEMLGDTSYAPTLANQPNGAWRSQRSQFNCRRAKMQQRPCKSVRADTELPLFALQARVPFCGSI